MPAYAACVVFNDFPTKKAVNVVAVFVVYPLRYWVVPLN
jgi:hypothetical protein